MPQKRCPYCGDEFEPKPNVAAIQTCCGKKRCKAKRKADAQAHWVSKNPDYFKGEYRRTRLWLTENPGYQRRYRAQNPDYVRRDNEDRRRRRIRARRRADIQDAYRLRLDGLLSALLGLPAPIYKTQSLAEGAAG